MTNIQRYTLKKERNVGHSIADWKQSWFQNKPFETIHDIPSAIQKNKRQVNDTQNYLVNSENNIKNIKHNPYYSQFHELTQDYELENTTSLWEQSKKFYG